MVRLGLDVGGTNTDAALVDGQTVVAVAKAPTTPDIAQSISTAIRALGASTRLQPGDITAVMVGTTHFTTAVAAPALLARTAAIRIGLPATAGLPPLADWPAELAEAVGGLGYLCRGGHDFQGRRYADFDDAEFLRIVDDAAAAGATAFALSSVFSPVNVEFELRAAELLRARLPGAPVSLSHEIGGLGIIQRENATVINAALQRLAADVSRELVATVRDAGVSAPVYLSQNDGTVMGIDYARNYPVATFGAGVTNALRGAAYLAGEESCIVVDIGGAVTSVGVVEGAAPQTVVGGRVAGIEMNFRMPDIVTVPAPPGVAGGEITEEHRDQLLRAVRRVRGPVDHRPVVVVGGGAAGIRDTSLAGIPVHRPRHYASANAIGAAISDVSSEVVRIIPISAESREAVLRQVSSDALDRVVAAGADPADARVTETDESSLSYFSGNTVRIRAKAVGRPLAVAHG
jgi:N-methylhydantoinase A/oxoprolinase/acetone carboxylase beta subunit